MISLAITAHNLTGVHRVRGEIRWDAEVFRFQASDEGDHVPAGPGERHDLAVSARAGTGRHERPERAPTR